MYVIIYINQLKEYGSSVNLYMESYIKFNCSHIGYIHYAQNKRGITQGNVKKKLVGAWNISNSAFLCQL